MSNTTPPFVVESSDIVTTVRHVCIRPGGSFKGETWGSGHIVWDDSHRSCTHCPSCGLKLPEYVAEIKSGD